jgi:serine/threonine-protein kinase
MDQPTQFGRYLAKGTIGHGAMGTIYLAEDPVIGRQVAIKVIQLQAGLSLQEIENLKTRFEREFRSAGTLSHPNIVTVYDVGTEGNTPFIAMEYVQGSTLEQLINEQRILSFQEIADLIVPICSGLDYAHENGVIHRDIKPANILLDRGRRPKITDFGVAKLSESGMTRTGAIVGTPWYMSPEQVTGQAVTGASDQFSVAVMTYQILTGERPFSGERSTTVLYKIVHQEPVHAHMLNPRLNTRLDDVLIRAFHKNPGLRYPTCTAFAQELQLALGVAPATTASGTLQSAPASAIGSPATSVALDARMTQVLQTPVPAPAQPTAKRPIVTQRPQLRRTQWLAAAGAIVVLGLVLGLYWRGAGGGGRAGSPAPQAAAPAAVGPQSNAANPPPAAAIRPANAPAPPAPAAPAGSGTYRIVTKPPGASIVLDGRRLEQTTPAEVTLKADVRHRLQLELNGYAAAGWTFNFDQLSAEQQRTRSLYFPLSALTSGTAAKASGAEIGAPGPAPAAGVSSKSPSAGPESPALSGPPGRVDPDLPRVRAGKDVPLPRRIRDAKPVYARAAVPTDRSPVVILELMLDPQGDVAEAKVLRSLTPELDQAALQSAWRWKFEPSIYKGKPVNAILTTTVQFHHE